MKHTMADIAIIGAGPAGLAAAVAAYDTGIHNILILDRNNWLGGILPQCIHDGFGIEETGTSMTGPEYAEMYTDMVKKRNIPTWQETMALKITKNNTIHAINKEGLHHIKAQSIILAMGCREKTRWNALIPGTRPSGIYTAGAAQAFINLYNIIPGNKILVLGSGDVGLIMARRLKFEGADVLGVVELLPYASGLPRNVVQCLDDYDIPLYLNHTVTNIQGKERLTHVTIALINKNGEPVANTESTIQCDTLLLSLGLIPENELTKTIDIQLDTITGGSIVNEHFETTMSGIFTCGNCLQVYDTVDLLAKNAKRAGIAAAHHVLEKPPENKQKICVRAGKNVQYVIPQTIQKPGLHTLTLRVKKPCGPVQLYLKTDKQIISKKKIRWVNPANMLEFQVRIPENLFKDNRSFEVNIDD
ncbi:MAG: NAD(P)/FAD-dependent oxidoreductase [Candidatus Thermoplasmatota archaeon]|nr:NAD(P)/FAD-dependent oxidoreductase [Candidatus Thermoplasmatota archaeon]